MDYVVVNCNRDGEKINRDIYGHFSEHLGRCIYGLPLDLLMVFMFLHITMLPWMV